MSKIIIQIGDKKFNILFPDLLRPLKSKERNPLYDSIEKNGVITPIIVDEKYGVIDGINRLKIASHMGLENVPVEVRSGLTHEQKLNLALELNDARRHLTALDRRRGKQKREEIAKSLKANPEQSNRQIADATGVDHHTVASERKKLEATGEIPLRRTYRS
jgi:ParB-like chromosome segregation protein Spo0J